MVLSAGQDIRPGELANCHPANGKGKHTAAKDQSELAKYGARGRANTDKKKKNKGSSLYRCNNSRRVSSYLALSTAVKDTTAFWAGDLDTFTVGGGTFQIKIQMQLLAGTEALLGKR